MISMQLDKIAACGVKNQMSASEPKSITRIVRHVRSFRITEVTLERLKSADVPDAVREKLARLKDQTFKGKGNFLAALQAAIGTGQDGSFEETISALAQIVDEAAEKEMESWIEQELRRIAAIRLGQFPNHPLETAELINEAYIELKQRVQNPKTPEWVDRKHFYSYASVVMFHILVDHVREMKRMGGDHQVTLSAAAEKAITGRGELSPDDLLILEEALNALEAKRPQAAKILKLRLIAGLTRDEVATVLGISVATVTRNLTMATAFLQGKLRKGD